MLVMSKVSFEMSKRTTIDCLTCGACCIGLYGQEGFCDISEADLTRLPKAFLRHVRYFSSFDLLVHSQALQDTIGAIRTKWRKQHAGPCKDFELCTCYALKGSVLHSVRCTIYEVRPLCCCDAVQPGSKTCQNIRHLFISSLDDLKSRT